MNEKREVVMGVCGRSECLVFILLCWDKKGLLASYAIKGKSIDMDCIGMETTFSRVIIFFCKFVLGKKYNLLELLMSYPSLKGHLQSYP